MTINKTKDGSKLTIALAGRLDTMTAPKLEAELTLDGITELIFDLKELEYMSSAGLRLLLSAQKKMMKNGSMVVRNVNDVIMEVFELTGFIDLLTIE